MLRILSFLINSMLLGIGLAMDAFTVSLANGLHDPDMRPGTRCRIAGTFAGFQALMPMLGWLCVRTAVHYFKRISVLIPWIALVLLCFIGGKMLHDGISEMRAGSRQEPAELTHGGLLMQGLATSIDALSVGFTIAEYKTGAALAAAAMIAAVTFLICLGGLALGRRLGMKLAGKASLLGGLLLIGIGAEIWLSHML